MSLPREERRNATALNNQVRIKQKFAIESSKAQDEVSKKFLTKLNNLIPNKHIFKIYFHF